MNQSSLVVGIVWGDGSWQGRFAKVDSEATSIADGIDRTLAYWKKNGAPTNANTVTRFQEFVAEFADWRKQWETFKGTSPWATDSNDAMLQTHEKRIVQLRKAYDALPDVIAISTPAPDAYQPPKPGEELSSVADIVKWGVIGGIALFGLKIVSDSGVFSSKKGK